MSRSAKSTTDYAFIKKWAGERGGRPASVKRTGNDGDPGIIRIDFPGYEGEDSLEEISWDQWFEQFESRGLALLYREERDGGEKDRFNKLVSRESVEEGA